MIARLAQSGWQDIRFGARLLARSPLFTLAAALTLALGLGANLTIFSWIDQLLYARMPGAHDPTRLVCVQRVNPNFSGVVFSYPNYRDLRDRSRSLDGLLACAIQTVNVTESGQPERVWGEIVSGNYFAVTGVQPILGRGFAPEEDRTPGTHPVTVISHAFWQRRFGGDPGIVGRDIQLNNRPFTVIGVAPPGFHGSWMGLSFDLWVPIMMTQAIRPTTWDPLENRGNNWLVLIGRLAGGVPLSVAQAELAALADHLAEEHPTYNATSTCAVVDLKDMAEGAPRYMGPVLQALFLLTGLVLLAACANVANLILVRAHARQKELAVRLAMGATRGRLVRQLLVEQLLLFGLGGGLSLLMLQWTHSALLQVSGSLDFPIAFAVEVNLRTLGFVLLLVFTMGCLFGLIPSGQAARLEVSAILKEEGATISGNRRRTLWRNGLVVAQVALALSLLISAGLFVRSLWRAGQADLGLEPHGRLKASVDLFPSGYTPQTGQDFQDRWLERVRRIPGVRSASLARWLPLGMESGGYTNSLEAEGYRPRPDEVPNAALNWVRPDYLATLGIPLAAGRDFSPRDDAHAPPVVIVNEALARTYFAGRDPLGGRIRLGEAWATIVGVARDHRFRAVDGPIAPLILIPLTQEYAPNVSVVLRTDGDPNRLAVPLRQTVRELDPRLPVTAVQTLEEHIRFMTLPQRMAAVMLSGFGALVLIITVVGVYAVLRHATVQRTREIGIRAAFGASPRVIVTLLLRQVLVVLGIGTALGVAGAAACTRAFSRLLIGIEAVDPPVFLFVPLLLGAVALLACLAPARRAARAWPAHSLRHD